MATKRGRGRTSQRRVSLKIRKIYKEKRRQGKSKEEAQDEAQGAAYGMARKGRIGPRGGYRRVRRGRKR